MLPMVRLLAYRAGPPTVPATRPRSTMATPRPASATTAGAALSEEGVGPRRAALRQSRSQDKRRRILRAALELWNERGFERAVDEATAAEIHRAEGVGKGTTFVHSAHTEDYTPAMTRDQAQINDREKRMHR